MKHLFCIGFGLLLGTACGVAQEQTNISPRAESVLRSACDFLAKTRAFSFSGEIWREHVNDAGQKVQFSRTVEMDVKRPNGLRMEISSPFSTRGFWYDGKTLTILDQTHNWYSAAAMPSALDDAVDTARDKYGIDLPLIDLAVSDPYKDATAKVQTGRYYGISPVLGVPCHHLAFTQENVDWQIWIEKGPQPLIRKFVITYKNEPDAPEFAAFITHWNMTDRIADSDFIFTPPKGASKIEMRTDEQSGGDTNAASPNKK
ncbi:MAG: DUF2092 domain-containing protein [Limisphaerales bacterium]